MKDFRKILEKNKSGIIIRFGFSARYSSIKQSDKNWRKPGFWIFTGCRVLKSFINFTVMITVMLL